MRKKYFIVLLFKSVGTVKSTLNSAAALSKYRSNMFDVYLINACGEWMNI